MDKDFNNSEVTVTLIDKRKIHAKYKTMDSAIMFKIIENYSNNTLKEYLSQVKHSYDYLILLPPSKNELTVFFNRLLGDKTSSKVISEKLTQAYLFIVSTNAIALNLKDQDPFQISLYTLDRINIRANYRGGIFKKNNYIAMCNFILYVKGFINNELDSEKMTRFLNFKNIEELVLDIMSMDGSSFFENVQKKIFDVEIPTPNKIKKNAAYFKERFQNRLQVLPAEDQLIEQKLYKFKRTIEKHGYTQTSFGHAVGLHQTYISLVVSRHRAHNNSQALATKLFNSVCELEIDEIEDLDNVIRRFKTTIDAHMDMKRERAAKSRQR